LARLRELARSGADALGRVLRPVQPSAAHYTAMAHIPSFLRDLQGARARAI